MFYAISEEILANSIPYPALPMSTRAPHNSYTHSSHVQWRWYGHEQLPWTLCAPATHTDIGFTVEQQTPNKKEPKLQ